MNRAKDLALKVLLISQIFIWVKYDHKESIIVIGICFVVMLFSKTSSRIDSLLEKVVKLLGMLILKIFLGITYLFVIIPSRIFYRAPKYEGSTFQNNSNKQLDFRKLW